MRLPLIAQQEFGVHLAVERKAKGRRRRRNEPLAIRLRWLVCRHRCKFGLVCGEVVTASSLASCET
jgi:hypothetical protein